MRPCIFLDRDGTLIDVVRDEETGNISVAFHPNHLRILPGVREGLTLLARAGFVFGIATNQPAPAKGQFSVAAVVRTNQALVELLAKDGIVIEHVAVCMHHEVGSPHGCPELIQDCVCRKPKPGLLEQLIVAMGAERSSSWLIGDSPGDIQAGRAAMLRTGLLFAPNRCELCPMRATEGVHPLAESGSRLPHVFGPTMVEVASQIVRAVA